MPRICWIPIAMYCLSLFFSGRIASAQAEDPGNGLFPVEMQTWEANEEHLKDGIRKANHLRRRLLSEAQDQSDAAIERIGHAIAIFQRGAAEAWGSDSWVSRFDVSPQRLRAQLAGSVELTDPVFEAFEGQWYGKWDELTVNHDWKTPQIYRPSRVIADDTPPVKAVQFAWVGNGFGWNILCEVLGSPTRTSDADVAPAVGRSRGRPGNFILGMVYYVAADDPGKVVGETPLVGFADGPNQLVWITESDIFLEATYVDARYGECYGIAGFKHQLLSESPETSTTGVQAIYTHAPQTRPAFKKFSWEGTQGTSKPVP